MNRVTEYIVISETGLDAFIPAVNDHIQKGWQPIGGICSYHMNIPQGNEALIMIEYCQAMVRFNDVVDLG